MPDKSKLPMVVIIGLILVSLSLAGTGFYLLQKEKANNVALQRELEDLRIKENLTSSRLQEYKKTIAQLELKLKDAQTNIDTLTTRLKEETDAKQKAQDQIQQLKVDLEQQTGVKSDLETKLDQAQKKLEETEARLKELESKKTQLEAKLKALEEEQDVELGTIVVGPEEMGTQVAGEPSSEASKGKISSLVGKVLVLNKDYDFVVINLGSRDGVNVGDIFSIYHNDQYIGDVRIAKIHDSMSAADFVSSDIKNQVNEGDKVVQKTE